MFQDSLLAIICTSVGGAALSAPWAFFHTGLYVGISLSIFTCLVQFLGVGLLVKAQEMCPHNPKNFYEVGYILLGRRSIFWVASIQWFLSFGYIILNVNQIATISGELTQMKMSYCAGFLFIFLCPIVV